MKIRRSATEDGPVDLYRYRSLAGEHGRRAVEDIVLHNRLYWASPHAFNDPFDCNPVLIFGTGERERSEYLRRAAANQVGKASRRERLGRRRQAMRKTPQQHESELGDQWKNWMAESSVACFSGVNNHPLMWAHYADSHRGVCWIFREQIHDVENVWMGFDVNYSEVRPLVNLCNIRDGEMFKAAVLNKSRDWAYEREYRMIEWRGRPGYRTFPREALLGVILGAKISDDDRKFVLKIVERRPDLRAYEAEIDRRHFAVNIRELA